MNIKKKFLINENSTIKDCIKKINLNGTGSLFVIKNNNKPQLLGTITDGDIRRFMLKNQEINTIIKDVYNKKPIILREEPNSKVLKKIFEENNIKIIARVDQNEKILEIFTIKDYRLKNAKKTSIFIMAGGKGLRMKPFTNLFPKALLPFKNSSIIEEIIKFFKHNGFEKIYITTGFKSNVLKDHLLKNKYKNIYFFKEKKPLGTIGGLSKIKNKITENFILTNCDTYIDVNIKDILKFHEINKNYITIVCSKINYTFDYGICKTDNKGILKNIEEKPTYHHLINTGFYILKKNCLNFIPKNKYFNATDLINLCLLKKKRVKIYSIEKNQWQDVGNWENYYKNINTKIS
jgi:dTDP-glucose pyrophosphorylase